MKILKGEEDAEGEDESDDIAKPETAEETAAQEKNTESTFETMV